jgi:hypothetical protein
MCEMGWVWRRFVNQKFRLALLPTTPQPSLPSIIIMTDSLEGLRGPGSQCREVQGTQTCCGPNRGGQHPSEVNKGKGADWGQEEEGPSGQVAPCWRRWTETTTPHLLLKRVCWPLSTGHSAHLCLLEGRHRTGVQQLQVRMGYQANWSPGWALYTSSERRV